jgi:hypothetical protein
VAGAVAGCLTAPWSRTVAVPRWFGLARLGEVAPVHRLLDVVLSRQTEPIRATTERMLDQRPTGGDGDHAGRRERSGG